jgi:hypothetical protein
VVEICNPQFGKRMQKADIKDPGYILEAREAASSEATAKVERATAKMAQRVENARQKALKKSPIRRRKATRKK